MLIKVPCFGQVISIVTQFGIDLQAFSQVRHKDFLKYTHYTYNRSICTGIAKCSANVNAELLA